MKIEQFFNYEHRCGFLIKICGIVELIYHNDTVIHCNTIKIFESQVCRLDCKKAVNLIDLIHTKNLFSLIPNRYRLIISNRSVSYWRDQKLNFIIKIFNLNN